MHLISANTVFIINNKYQKTNSKFINQCHIVSMYYVCKDVDFCNDAYNYIL